jgi:hypothetical protein
MFILPPKQTKLPRFSRRKPAATEFAAPVSLAFG